MLLDTKMFSVITSTGVMTKHHTGSESQRTDIWILMSEFIRASLEESPQSFHEAFLMMGSLMCPHTEVKIRCFFFYSLFFFTEKNVEGIIHQAKSSFHSFTLCAHVNAVRQIRSALLIQKFPLSILTVLCFSFSWSIWTRFLWVKLNWRMDS